jgi:beta-glucosidase
MENLTELINKMTLEEKAAMCIGANSWTTTPVDRLGIPVLSFSDGPHGVRKVVENNGKVTGTIPATCFPTASCTASSWDVDLIHTMGQALAEECIALNVDVLLGPGTNMKRSPLCGRNFEYFSEDPYLAGQMAASFINGVQSKGVGTSLKHFAANNQETRRMTVSAEIDERTLREIYLPAFETAVKKAHPWTVMCAYNKLNRVYASENHRLLVDILKNEWGFEGFVISDWGAVHHRVTALKGGLDLEMPGPRERRVMAVVEAVRSGELSEAVLDDAVRRILRIVLKAAETLKGDPYDQAAHHALARRIASEGMVLLKNNGILPLRNPRNIAVIGSSAKDPYIEGGGSSHVNPIKVDGPLEELQKLAGDARLSYTEGYTDDDRIDQGMIDEAVKHSSNADVTLLYIALPKTKESEEYDRADLDLRPQQVALIKAVTAAQPDTVVILNNGTPVVMSEWIDGAAAVLEAWMMGQAGAGAIADILFGKINPSGKLAETFPLRLVDAPSQLNFPGENDKLRYGEGIFIGYRYYDAKEMPVLFPFGFGLSYTTFEYSNPKVSASTFSDVEGVTVSIDVTNMGKVSGKEVVQVYVHDQKSELSRPPKELKGFVKLELKPGETKTASVRLESRAFAYYHPGYQRWITEDGQFDILIGASSRDIRFSQTVSLQSTQVLPSLLNRDSTLRDWLDDPRGKSVFEPVYLQIMAEKGTDLDAEHGSDIRVTLEASEYFMELPLRDYLYFQVSTQSESPEQLVEGMLTQVNQRN